MSIKIYQKNGRKNYKEQKLIRDLQPIIDEKMKNNPELAESFRPATTYEELEAFHRQYVSEDVDWDEIDDNENINTMDKNEGKSEENDFFKQIDESSDNVDFIDPFNREEPIVRDYVTGGGLREKNTVEGPTRTQFDEPVTFEEAFELPNEEDGDEAEPVKQSSNRSEPKREQRKKPERSEPINPSFDEMSGAKKKKSTKKFAKYIVEAVCALAEKGFVWYANKDINEAKLNEYELNGEMDLSVLVTLDTGQQATVKQFFIQQCYMAEEYAKFDPEEKADMSEALAEVFMEKGIAPTATQEALIVIGGVLVKKGAILLSLKAQTNSLLDQLRMNTQGQAQYQQAYQEPYYEPTAQPQPEPQVENAEPEMPIDMPTFDFTELSLEEPNDLEIDQVVETKE